MYALIRVARENARYDEHHMERLRYNCRILAEAMQLSSIYGDVISDSYVDTIEQATPLCDLGNMAIPTEILQKKGRLTPVERRVMGTHTTIGARILNDIAENGGNNGFIQMAIEIAYSHHENWDGSGYPEGRKGDEIPLCAQIVSMVNTYCALTEDRTYRSAFSREDALAIMEEDAERRFNPNIFWIMKKIVRQFH